MTTAYRAFRASAGKRREWEQRQRDQERALQALEGRRTSSRGTRRQTPRDIRPSQEQQQAVGAAVDAVLGPADRMFKDMTQAPVYSPGGVAGRVGDFLLGDMPEAAARAAAGEEDVYWQDTEPEMVQTRGGMAQRGSVSMPTSAGVELAALAADATPLALTKARHFAEDAARLPGRIVDDYVARQPGAMPAVTKNAKVKKAKVEGAESPQKVRARARKEHGVSPTVTNPTTVAYPRIYSRPDELIDAAELADENPMMKELFGVDRDDLYQIAEEGRREGNRPERPYKTTAKPRGSKHAERVTNAQNAQRMLDIIEEAQKRPKLYKGMASWYTMDPLYWKFEEIYGPERAPAEYQRFNAVMGMASSGAEVLNEIPRGTGANWLERQGRLDDFIKYGGAETPSRPADMAGIPGHPYHTTAHGVPMQEFFRRGDISGMQSAKVPSYIAASGVPETGFQTEYPVGDGHFSRIIGLPDVRSLTRAGGVSLPKTQSASVSEMLTVTPWWQEKVAKEAGIRPVPAQAVVWGAGANATGVTSPVGASKLELFTRQVEKAAARLGIKPKDALEQIILGKTHAGEVDPELLAWISASGLGAAALAPYLAKQDEDDK